MKNILFLCTGNSCRSQMAEAWAHKLKGHLYHFYSAGTDKHGMNSRAIEVMEEVGVEMDLCFSKTTVDISDVKMDIVFTVCSDADENCPFFEGAQIIHKGFDDPPRLSKTLSDEKEILDIYRRVRDEIKIFVTDIEKYI